MFDLYLYFAEVMVGWGVTGLNSLCGGGATNFSIYYLLPCTDDKNYIAHF